MDLETISSPAPVFTDAHLQEYLEALRACIALTPTALRLGTGVAIQPGRKYTKVMLTENGRPSSVHAFIERQTGALIKAAGLNAPQRNSDGTLAVRYQLADNDSRTELCEMLRNTPGGHYGGYLYQR